jgi:hypothetical protein
LLQRVNAVAVLMKPFDEALLFDAIFRALAFVAPLWSKELEYFTALGPLK